MRHNAIVLHSWVIVKDILACRPQSIEIFEGVSGHMFTTNYWISSDIERIGKNSIVDAVLEV